METRPSFAGEAGSSYNLGEKCSLSGSVESDTFDALQVQVSPYHH